MGCQDCGFEYQGDDADDQEVLVIGTAQATATVLNISEDIIQELDEALTLVNRLHRVFLTCPNAPLYRMYPHYQHMVATTRKIAETLAILPVLSPPIDPNR